MHIERGQNLSPNEVKIRVFLISPSHPLLSPFFSLLWRFPKPPFSSTIRLPPHAPTEVKSVLTRVAECIHVVRRSVKQKAEYISLFLSCSLCILRNTSHTPLLFFFMLPHPPNYHFSFSDSQKKQFLRNCPRVFIILVMVPSTFSTNSCLCCKNFFLNCDFLHFIFI